MKQQQQYLTQIEKDGDDTTEKSPLKEGEGDTKEANGIKEVKGNQLIATLQDPKTRLVLGVAAAVILLLVVASTVVGVIVMGSQPEPEPVSQVLNILPNNPFSFQTKTLW